MSGGVLPSDCAEAYACSCPSMPELPVVATCVLWTTLIGSALEVIRTCSSNQRIDWKTVSFCSLAGSISAYTLLFFHQVNQMGV